MSERRFKTILELGAFVIAEEERKKKEERKAAKRKARMEGVQFSLFDVAGGV